MDRPMDPKTHQSSDRSPLKGPLARRSRVSRNPWLYQMPCHHIHPCTTLYHHVMNRVRAFVSYHLAAYLAGLEGKRCQQGLVGCSSKELQTSPAEYITNSCFFAKAHKPYWSLLYYNTLNVHHFETISKHDQPSNPLNKLGHIGMEDRLGCHDKALWHPTDRIIVICKLPT